MGLDMVGEEGRLAELADPALVAPGRIAGIGEFGVEESGNAGLGHFDPYEPSAQSDAIGIIMFAREAAESGSLTRAQRTSGWRFTLIEMPIPLPHSATPNSPSLRR